MSKVLLLEDESVIRKQIKLLLERNDYDVTEASTVDEALAHDPESYDVILADIRLPNQEGIVILQHRVHVPVILMTSYASVRSAVDSMRLGAADYISKPFDHNELLTTINRTIREERVSTQNAALQRDLDRNFPFNELDSSSHTMQQSLRDLKELPAEQTFVYVHGERGTGKELLARLCHRCSDRHAGPLVFADLHLYDSKDLKTILFGSYKSSPPVTGFIKIAHHGTLVVRGISALDFDFQLKLNAQLTEVKSKILTHNVRLVLLERESPAALLYQGILHPELFRMFKSNVFRASPLRQRREDITLLSDQYLSLFAKRYLKRDLYFTNESIHVLQAYHWPGNVSELKNTIERAVLTVNSEEIKPVNLGIKVVDNSAVETDTDSSIDSYIRYFILKFEKHLSETELANKLGISRKALWQRRQKMVLPRAT